ncbi:MAG: Stk1 family PASTA domain-containing Ser/Thr kinase [Bacilli bacterium]
MISKGSKINNRYQIIKTLGEGGMANVYLAYDTILNRNVAVKVLRGDLAGDDKFVRRFQREALSASSLSHPNIVEMYDVGEDDGQYYIVMEYVDGKTLKQLTKKRGKLTVGEVVDIMLQVTDGMAHAHDAYIIHRDIKPQNIMILENGMIKITDFGIATALNSTQLTQTNSIMGSVHYLPPEQASGKGSTIRSDIYSIGILMYELLTGSVPFKGENAVEIALKHIKEIIPSIKKELPELPQSIENIILRSTAKNPKNRYADARSMHEDLKTSLLESRRNEPRIVYKYSENELDETIVLDDAVKSIKDKKEKENRLKEKEEIKEESKKQNKLLIILASVFTGLIIITTSLVLLLPRFMTKPNVKVPDVSCKSEVEASNLLTKAGFIVREELGKAESDEIEEGYVVRTSPNAHKIVKKGSIITLYVSVGTGSFILEDYAGKNYIEVQTTLKNLYNCKTAIEYETIKEADKIKEGAVLKTIPEKGSKVKKDVNCKVTLILPEAEVKYPDFTLDYTVEKIEAFCKKNEITLKLLYEQNEDTPEGTIIKQSRPAGSVVLPGYSLTITVSKLPDAPAVVLPEGSAQ